MRETMMRSKLTIAGGLLAVAMLAGSAGLIASQTSAQTTTTDDGTIPVQWSTGNPYEEPKGKAKAKAKGGTTPAAICEAQERTEARWQKWINQGVPEEFGSEEPFTFDPSVC